MSFTSPMVVGPFKPPIRTTVSSPVFSVADSEAASVVVSSAAVVVSSAEEAAAVVSVVDDEQPARRDPAIAAAIMTDNIFLIT